MLDVGEAKQRQQNNKNMSAVSNERLTKERWLFIG